MSRGVDDPWQYALDTLARRDLTAGEVRARLLRRKVARQLVDDVVARLVERGFVDDRRVAYNHARFRRDQARRGPLRVRAELLARGLARELVDDAVRDSYPEADASDALRRAAERLAGAHGVPGDRPGRERLARRLLNAGFPHADVLGWLSRGAGRSDHAE